VAADDPWAFARQVDAAYVRTLPRRRPERMGPTEAERYLFYRGLGAFPMPLAVEAAAGGKATLRSRHDRAVSAAVSLEVRGGEARMRVLAPALAPEDDVSLGAVPFAPKAEVVEETRRLLESVLAKEGLYADEAVAMVRTWSRSWLSSEGTRILYVVPRELTDRLLPLRIDPAPDEVLRVLVGRLEYLTPDAEAEVEQALRDRSSKDDAARVAAHRRLARLDRFLEAATRRVLAKTSDAEARRGAEEVLATLGPR
jgi:hypothetical protein